MIPTLSLYRIGLFCKTEVGLISPLTSHNPKTSMVPPVPWILSQGATYLKIGASPGPLRQRSWRLYHKQWATSHPARQVHICQLHAEDLHVSSALRGEPLHDLFPLRWIPFASRSWILPQGALNPCPNSLLEADACLTHLVTLLFQVPLDGKPTYITPLSVWDLVDLSP